MRKNVQRDATSKLKVERSNFLYFVLYNKSKKSNTVMPWACSQRKGESVRSTENKSVKVTRLYTCFKKKKKERKNRTPVTGDLQQS